MDELIKQMRAILDKAEAESRELTADEIKEFDALTAKCDELKAAEARRKKIADIETEQRKADDAKRETTATETAEKRERLNGTETKTKVEIPYQSVRNFEKRDGERPAHERAYRYGQFMRSLLNIPDAVRYCQEQGIQYRGHVEYDNSLGGFMVPEEFDPDLIRLREQYGVFRRNARVVNMGSDVKTRRKVTSFMTLTPVGEAEAGSESTTTKGKVELIARKWMGLTTISSELNEDSIVNLGDEAIRQFGEAQANTEDLAGFLGDGTSTYHGILGVKTKLNTIATAGKKNAAASTANNWANITLPNMQQLPSSLPEYPGMQPKWYCSKPFFAQVMEVLALAAGGNTAEHIQNGVPQKRFLGYDVEITQVMPKTASGADIVCLFGDLRMAADLGDRRAAQIAYSTDATVGGRSVFETDEIALRYVTRFGINVHTVGDTSNVETFTALVTQ